MKNGISSLRNVNPYAQDGLDTPAEIQAQQAYLEKFGSGAAYQASCIGGPPVEAVPLNTSGKGPEENPRMQFDIVNNTAEDEVIRWGGPAAFTGSSPFFGLTPSAADSAVSDQFGAGVRACQGFSEMVANQPVIVNEIQIFSDDTIQIQQSPVYKEIAYDFTVNPFKINVNHSFSRQDNNGDTWAVFGNWSLTFFKWLELTSKAETEMTVVITLAAVNSIYDFRRYGCAPTSPDVVPFPHAGANGSQQQLTGW